MVQTVASLVAQTVKNSSTTQEIGVRYLGQEDSVDKGMATHYSVRAWGIPCTEEPGGLESVGFQRVGHD